MTVEGRPVHSIHIRSQPIVATPPVVLVIGGLHAREWVPPDAVLSFGEKLLAAYTAGAPMKYPGFTDGSVPYAPAEVSARQVQHFVDELELILLPLANPDGRHHSLSNKHLDSNQGKKWRGNRNLDAVTGCPTHGVDLNRNFDWQWDPSNSYYNAPSQTFIETHLSTPGCDSNPNGGQAYRGSAGGSEPETKNIQELIDLSRPTYFMDVHSNGRQIAVPWGIAPNQTTDPTKSFKNSSLDRTASAGSGRDVVDAGDAEYMPNDAAHPLLRWRNQITDHMIATIEDQAGADSTARSRSRYTRIETSEFYLRPYFPTKAAAPLPGSADGYAFSRPFRQSDKMAFSCTLECSSLNDGEQGHFPSPGLKYQKVEREVHAAMYAILDVAVRTGVPGHKTPLP